MNLQELEEKMLQAQLKANENTQTQCCLEFALIIEMLYDKMLQRAIPKEALLSTKFKEWIIKEKHKLILDSLINFKNYQTDKNLDFVRIKIAYLNAQLNLIENSFKKFIKG